MIVPTLHNCSCCGMPIMSEHDKCFDCQYDLCYDEGTSAWHCTGECGGACDGSACEPDVAVLID